MQNSKTSRNGSSDAPQRTSPATPRSSRVAKTGGNETDSAGITPTRTPTERSPKVIERRSPRSPVTEKKRPSRLTELESKVNQLQDELKKTKEQLSASEARRRQAQQEADEAKKQGQDASSKLEESQCQLVELSAAEESRLQELRKIQQERDRTWQAELEALQKQQGRHDRIWQIAFGSGFKCNSAVWKALRSVNPAKEENNPWMDEIDTFPVEVPKVSKVAE